LSKSKRLHVLLPEGLQMHFNGTPVLFCEPSVVEVDSAGKTNLEKDLGTSLPEVAKYGGPALPPGDEYSDTPPAYVQVAMSLVHHFSYIQRSGPDSEEAVWKGQSSVELTPKEDSLYDTATQRIQEWIEREAQQDATSDDCANGF